MSFLMMEAERRTKDNQLLTVGKIIDWKKIEEVAGKLGRSGYGPSGYEISSMIKALILQAWHNLSDPKLEEALKVRLDFMVFTGFEYEVPDETTFCLFRNKLTNLGLWDKILDEINDQLIRHGLAVSASAGAVLDATIITSAARPNKFTEGIVEDRNEEEEAKNISCGDERLSADPDAKWLKKGKHSYFGYKAFIVSDAEDGYIRKVEVEPANVSEVRSLEKAITGLKPRRLYADKGYASAENRRILNTLNIKDGIMHKAARSGELSHWQKVFNRLVSKSRFIIEQAFGTLKRGCQIKCVS